MNNFVFQQAQGAYENEDYAHALNLFNTVLSDSSFPLEQGEQGLLFHQIGNCYVKLGNYPDAVAAYSNAVNDASYSEIGTVYFNLGMAHVYMNDLTNAIASFQTAVNQPNYNSKYKAYTAMGNALMKRGKSAEAGAVFRKAALDENNPDPTKALLNLGVCFMALGRSTDAVIAYESAFQFDMKPEIKNRLYANLGQAYVATGQMGKAVNAFDEAIADKTYHLSDSASVDYQRAIAAVSRGDDQVPVGEDGQSADNYGAAVGAGVAAGAVAAAGASVANASTNPDQLQGQSDFSGLDVVNDQMYVGPEGTAAINQVPVQDSVRPVNPSDDRFYSVSDAEFEEWTKSTEKAAYHLQKKHKKGKVFLIVFLILILLTLCGGVFAYTQGYGLPTQEMVTKDLFSNPAAAKNTVYANSVSDSKKSAYTSMIKEDPNPTIDGLNRTMSESTVYVTGKTSTGGEVKYKIKMTRDLIGWKIQSVDLAFASQE